MSIYKSGIFFGISVCDISTGEFYSSEIKETNNFEVLLDEIARFSPAEIISNSEYIGKEVVICGWVRTSRDSKNMAFLEVNDGTTLKHIQVVIDKSKMSDVAQYLRLDHL